MDTNERGPADRPALDLLPTEVELAALRSQLEELEGGLSDLVRGDGDESLRAIVSRVARTVGADVCLVRGPDAAPVAFWSPGSQAAVERAGRVPVPGADLGGGAVWADVCSGDRLHGRLLAVARAGTTVDAERVQRCAGHLAMLLDLADLIGNGRSDHRRVGTLVTLAADLSSATDVVDVGRVVTAAMREIADSDGATTMLWDPSLGAFETVAVAGDEPGRLDHLLGTPLALDRIPEIADYLTRRRTAVFRASTVSPELAQVLREGGTETVVVVPLLAGDVFMGVCTASWAPCATARQEHAHEVGERIVAVGHLASTALHRVQLEGTVHRQSHHDALTGLPNRKRFATLVEEALRAAGEDQRTALLFCDLDRFKGVNDRLGHAAGDELLRQTAARIRRQLRPGDVVARIGGDEFCVLLSEGVEDDEQAAAVARRLVETLDVPYRIDGREVRVTSSIGVAVHLGTDGRGDRLLAAADQAMRDAKAHGRDQVVLAGAVDAALVVPSLEAELARAVESDQLRLYFQPVVSLSPVDGHVVVGAEALLRWAHPRLGLLAPGSFLPLAEETGLVSELDLWALRAACRALASWVRPDDAPMRVAVNLASATLVDQRLLPTVRAELNGNGLRPERLHLEIVESRSLADLPGVVEALVELRQMGVRISLDDFGTGFSTLSWLQALPVDQIKIDRSFIMNLSADGPPLALVRGVLALARELGIEVIAEGVEEPEQLALLRDAGCTMVQGYLLGRPGPEMDTAGPTARARSLLPVVPEQQGSTGSA